jgi:RimJ/RimL family protein N-acetyltransferase
MPVGMRPPAILAGPLTTSTLWSESYDLADAWAAFDSDRAWPTGFLGAGEDRPRTVDEFRTHLRQKFLLPLAVYAVRNRDQEFIGLTGILSANTVATMFAPRVWGGQESSEVRRLLLDWAFDDAETSCAFWISRDGNARSMRSLLALCTVSVEPRGRGLLRFELGADRWPEVRERLLSIASGATPTVHEARAAR